MTKEQKSQFTLRISNANSTELVVVLYDMTLEYLKEGREAGSDEQLAEAIRKARGCINELLASLHTEHEIARNMQSLYLFCIRRLATAARKKDKVPLEEVQLVLAPLRDAYDKIAQQNTSGPVMKNTQTVYSGLTYGKTASLSESLAETEGSRGMFV